MKASDGLSVTLSTYDYGVAEILNMSDEEIEKWARNADELPDDAEIFDGDLDDTIALFRIIAAAAREQVADAVTGETARHLRDALDKAFGPDVGLKPRVEFALAAPRKGAAVTSVYLGWQVVYAKEDAAVLAPPVVERIIDALETLCGLRKEHYAVCEAPAVRDPESQCERIFLARNSTAQYCSGACKTRASRADQ